MIEKLKKVLDEDEDILYMKELLTVDYTTKKQRRNYKWMKPFYPDDDFPLRAYTLYHVITNKHLVKLCPDRSRYPYWYKKVDISHIIEPREEFCFHKWDKLTEITKIMKPKKDRYNIGVYFDLIEHDLLGDDAPNCWFDDLDKEEFDDLLDILIKVAPQAKIVEGWH